MLASGLDSQIAQPSHRRMLVLLTECPRNGCSRVVWSPAGPRPVVGGKDQIDKDNAFGESGRWQYAHRKQ
jgi:hypothetical protein